MQRQAILFRLYLTLLAILGAGVITLATWRMGPGVSTDAARVMSTAENLAGGRGLVEYRGQQLTQFPPLYPIILAFGSLITGLDVFIVGWILNIIVFGALIWLTGSLLQRAHPDEPIIAYLGSWVILTSTGLIEICANISSDPLFLVMVLFFMISACSTLRSGANKDIASMATLTIISCFQRYAGLTLVIVGSLLAAYAKRKDPRKSLATGSLFALITGAPILAWGYLHNAPVDGTVFGGRLPALPVLNFLTGVDKVLYWFIPYSVISAIGGFTLLMVILAVLALIIVATGYRSLQERMEDTEVVPHIIFLLIYGAVLVFNISYYELKGLETDRVHVMALPSLLVLLAVPARQTLKAAKDRFGNIPVYITTVIIFLIWSIYPISKSADYVLQSMRIGDASPYNSINKRDIRTSALAGFLNSLDSEGKCVYSNGGDTTWLMWHKRINPLPTLRSIRRAAELKQRYGDWPGVGNEGYIVWIRAEAFKTSYATPAELNLIADVTLIYSDKNGEVYSVKAR